MANSDFAHMTVSDRVRQLLDDARARYGCVVVVNQSVRTPQQAQAFHVYHMFLYNLFWETGKGHIVPNFEEVKAPTISWAHLSDLGVNWALIRSEDFLRTISNQPVRRPILGESDFPRDRAGRSRPWHSSA
jgi:hypothetical protein